MLTDKELQESVDTADCRAFVCFTSHKQTSELLGWAKLWADTLTQTQHTKDIKHIRDKREEIGKLLYQLTLSKVPQSEVDFDWRTLKLVRRKYLPQTDQIINLILGESK